MNERMKEVLVLMHVVTEQEMLNLHSEVQ